MAQPTKAESKMVDKDNNPQLANRLASVTVPTDLATSITAITALIERMEGHGLVEDN